MLIFEYQLLSKFFFLLSNNMGGGSEWDKRMMESMKNFDLSSPEVKQQFGESEEFGFFVASNWFFNKY